MSFTKIPLTNSEWTLVAGPVTAITFQNVGQYGIYVNFTAGSTAPADSVGLVYETWNGELKRSISELTMTSGADHVWAKSLMPTGSMIVEA